MNPIDMILWPFKWIVSVVLWLFHMLFTAVGMDPASGLTWVLEKIGSVHHLPDSGDAYPDHPAVRQAD